jgi:hypothetical protein
MLHLDTMTIVHLQPRCFSGEAKEERLFLKELLDCVTTRPPAVTETKPAQIIAGLSNYIKYTIFLNENEANGIRAESFALVSLLCPFDPSGDCEHQLLTVVSSP